MNFEDIFFHVKPIKFNTLSQTKKWCFNHVTFLVGQSSDTANSDQLRSCEFGPYTPGDLKIF